MRSFVRKKCNEIKKEIKRAGEDKLTVLNDRERKILKMRMGMDGTYYTLEEIAEELDMNHRQNVWKYQQKGLEKLQEALSEENLFW